MFLSLSINGKAQEIKRDTLVLMGNERRIDTAALSRPIIHERIIPARLDTKPLPMPKVHPEIKGNKGKKK